MYIFVEQNTMNRKLHYLAWGLQGLLIAILLLDIVVKVISDDHEVWAFYLMGFDAFGMRFTIFMEAVSVTGLVVQRFMREGAILAVLLCAVGVFFHLTELNINFYGDDGRRFYLNVLGLALALAIFFIRTHLSAILYKRGAL